VKEAALGLDPQTGSLEHLSRLVGRISAEVLHRVVVGREEALIRRDTDENPTVTFHSRLHYSRHESDVVFNVFNDIKHQDPAKGILGLFGGQRQRR
jgi:hypothetical protein